MDDAQLSQAADALQAKMTDSFGSVVRFEFEGGGALTVDGNAEPPAVAKGAEGDADCTITASEDTFREMMDGDLDPTIECPSTTRGAPAAASSSRGRTASRSR